MENTNQRNQSQVSQNEIVDRIPPHDADAEKALLGAVLIEQEATSNTLHGSMTLLSIKTITDAFLGRCEGSSSVASELTQ